MRRADKRARGGDAGERRDGEKRVHNVTGGIQLGPAAGTAPAAPPPVLGCDLCAATFPSHSLLSQHLEGVAHHKALARQQAEHERRQRLGQNAAAADAALASAAWHAPRRAPAAGGGGAAAEGEDRVQDGKRPRRPPPQPKRPDPRSLTTHLAMLQQARGEDGQGGAGTGGARMPMASPRPLRSCIWAQMSAFA
jgi:hypothetical protein